MMMPRILLVEDDDILREEMATWLEFEGYVTTTAASGQAGLQEVIDEKYDLVVSDIMMPDMSGYEVLHHLRSNPATRHIPVIFVTAMTEFEDEERGFALGAVDYIVKPVNPAALRLRLREGHGRCEGRAAALRIEVLEAQQQRRAPRPRIEPAEQRCKERPGVGASRGGRSEAADVHGERFTDTGRDVFFSECMGDNYKIVPGMRIMGAPSDHCVLKDLMEELVQSNIPSSEQNKLTFPYTYQVRMMIDRHFEHTEAFRASTSKWIVHRSTVIRDCVIVPGETFVVCTRERPRKLIDAEQWLTRTSEQINEVYDGEEPVVGIDFPLEQALSRTKTKWIGMTKASVLLESKTLLALHLHYALFDLSTKTGSEVLNISPFL